jgi:hypothetical protein
MQAITGEIPTVIRDLQKNVLGSDGFDGHIDWGHARGRDFQCIASIVYLMEKYPSQHTPHAQQLEKWLSDGKVTPKFRTKIFDTFQTFLAIVRNKTLCAPFKNPTRVSPIEFVMSGVLVSAYRDKLSLTQLSSAIEKLRACVRAKEKDIRMNTRTMKHMHDFITRKINGVTLKSDKNGDVPASKAHSTSTTKQAAKRKRQESEDEGEGEKKPPRKSPILPSETPRKVTSSSALNSAGVSQSSKPAKGKSSVASTPKAEAKVKATNISTSKYPTKKPVTSATTSSAVVPSRTFQPRISTTSTVPSSKIQAGPMSATVSTTLAPLTPKPPSRPPSAPPKVSTPSKISSATSTHPQRMMPPPPSIKGSSRDTPPSGSTSTTMDRLAPILAAKAAISGNAANGPESLQPLHTSVVPSTSIPGQTPVQVVRDPRRRISLPVESASPQPLFSPSAAINPNGEPVRSVLEGQKLQLLPSQSASCDVIMDNRSDMSMSPDNSPKSSMQHLSNPSFHGACLPTLQSTSIPHLP